MKFRDLDSHSFNGNILLLWSGLSAYLIGILQSTPIKLFHSKWKNFLKPGFHMSGKSQTVWDFTVSRPSQILLTNENWKSDIPIVWDERGQIWRIGSVFIFSTRPRFLQWLAIIADKWKLKFVPSAMDFAHYQSPKLLGSSPLSQRNNS